jgi:hypothetical protein
MKLVLLFGDAAVGKMTVGQELMKITGLRLFHNHMTIEPVLEVFGSFHETAILRLRDVIFEEFAKTDLPGMIFTFMWAFNQPSDWETVGHICEIFRSRGAELYFVELDAPLEVRLARNATANRLRHKASKRDLEQSDRRLLEDSERYRCVSREGEIPYPNFLWIENSALSPKAAAQRIRDRFDL